MKRLPALLLPLTLAACAVGPDYQRPAALPAEQVRLAEALENGTVTPSPLPDQWWHLFNDAELDRLVAQALTKNTDLRAAAANLQRARAMLSEAGAARLPTSGTSAQFSHSQQVIPALGRTVTNDFFSLGFDASYEADLFGGVSRSIEAARADAASAQAAVDAARVAVAAETTRAYAAACGFGEQADVARETESLQARTLDLTERRLAAGRGTRAEVDAATVLVEQARAQVPVFEAERRAALYALAVLTGDAPSAIIDSPAARCRTVPAAPQPLPVGDGQALLARRPDVRQAERTLAADTARIGVATAALYPSITLLGGVSLGATRFSNLGNAGSVGYSLGPLISWNFPLNGAARARVEQSKAVAEGSLARFDGAVLTALKEAEQALARAGGAATREDALRRAMTASTDAARLSRIRFDYGADSFLQLLDAERQRAAARAALAQAEAARADAQISVFKALGGGWETASPPN
ncbi:efflux transporter outer membrane subunit [Novosphingobium sp. PASSN1]|uniref:efflux transporter outer membrane subunit n=1 Tax=Novosphingobium sp. PASSN1 TaxID=2015561 RepID=UPI000BD73240|nr:TolC family protein [Novosphingobium sp. PASSN1]OYU35434.1 MAG: RND transporter [Novosphingobium sp. PASSN1]